MLITNHTAFDGTLTNIAALERRQPGEPNPYIVRREMVRRYLTVAEECGKATLLAAEGKQ
jgi:hypothetical protein